ncbi:dipeptidase [Lactobacillus delbrueckii subsp. bulgaricus]
MAEVTDQAQGLTGEELTAFLTKANQETVVHCRQESKKLWGQLFKEAIKLSKLTFNMDKNL